MLADASVCQHMPAYGSICDKLLAYTSIGNHMFACSRYHGNTSSLVAERRFEPVWLHPFNRFSSVHGPQTSGSILYCQPVHWSGWWTYYDLLTCLAGWISQAAQIWEDMARCSFLGTYSGKKYCTTKSCRQSNMNNIQLPCILEHISEINKN